MAELKLCPFCGGAVEFDSDIAIYNRKIFGKCLSCEMMFMYQERHEPLELHQRNGDLPVVTTLKAMTRLNAPFEEVWNRRVDTSIDDDDYEPITHFFQD